jgi:hypothetical protein
MPTAGAHEELSTSTQICLKVRIAAHHGGSRVAAHSLAVAISIRLAFPYRLDLRADALAILIALTRSSNGKFRLDRGQYIRFQVI